MLRVLVVCMLLAGSAALDNNCWHQVDNMYMSCYAQGIETKGTREEQFKRCIDLEDDCKGVTCSKDAEGEKCTVRHHHECEGEFLTPSSSGETTYIKICKVSEHVWEQHDDKYIPCYAKQDEDQGELLERKIRCAELGNECIGVTCKYSDPKDKVGTAKNCTVRDHRAGCATDGTVLVDGKNEISWTMDPTTPPPETPKTPAPAPGEDCTFETHDERTFTCNPPKPTEQRLNLANAKAKCIKMKDTGNFCNGVVCDSSDPTIESCVVHTHCVKEGEQMLTKATSVVHMKKCSNGNWCMDPCHTVPEFAGHVCENDCDCTGLRYCSDTGYCTTPKGLSPYDELCITDSMCKYEKHANKYMPCQDEALAVVGTMSLGDAQKQCTIMRGQCSGITCEDGKCSLRNHLMETCEMQGRGLFTSKTEDTYLKCCGPERDIRCPGSAGGSSGGHATFLIFLIFILLGVVAFLAYKKHLMEKEYIAPNAFKAVPQDEELADNHWVIEDTKEDERDD
eukprot:TRINITY_DN37766_c0_g1_i1.p1 TRINITY_DN37766_c0_g1~~TRINITY_DN37766_c0_g1_i1.p1  ORF type:complete len:508 (+),score=192.35 TRINITY_DN37766_c0_g1_i1:122-1645(+)